MRHRTVSAYALVDIGVRYCIISKYHMGIQYSIILIFHLHIVYDFSKNYDITYDIIYDIKGFTIKNCPKTYDISVFADRKTVI